MKDKPYLLEVYHTDDYEKATVQYTNKKQLIDDFPFLDAILSVLNFKSIKLTLGRTIVSIKRRRE